MAIRTFGSDAPDSVFAFLDESVSARGRKHWCWKYRIGSDRPTSAFYWEQDDGSIVGFIGLMRTNLHANGQRHAAAWFVDWHVDADKGGVGVGVGLLRKAEADAGILLTLQGSPDTRALLPRLGWQQSLAPHTWVLPLTGHFLAHALEQRSGAWASYVAAPLRALCSLAGPFLNRRPQVAVAGAELVDVDRFAANYDQVWYRCLKDAAPAMSRDADYLNYLCADYPDGGYRLQLLKLGGNSVGHLISRTDSDRHGLRRGRIVDLVCPASTPQLEPWLIASACRQLQQASADYIECVASTPRLTTLLGAGGFRSRRSVPIWYHRLANGVPDPDTWQISLLDCDRAYR